MDAAAVWETPAERSASSIPQERVMKFQEALTQLNKDFLAFQDAREQDDLDRTVAAASRLAANLTATAPLARLIERAAVAARSTVPNQE